MKNQHLVLILKSKALFSRVITYWVISFMYVLYFSGKTVLPFEAMKKLLE